MWISHGKQLLKKGKSIFHCYSKYWWQSRKHHFDANSSEQIFICILFNFIRMKNQIWKSLSQYTMTIYTFPLPKFIWFWFICWRIVNIVIEPSHQITINEWKTRRVHMPVSIFVFLFSSFIDFVFHIKFS